jgi:hypothetical protein
VGKLRWQTAGMFSEAAMVEPWDGMGEATMAEPTRHKRGFWVDVMLTLVMKSQWVCYKLEKIIEKPYSVLLVKVHLGPLVGFGV